MILRRLLQKEIFIRLTENGIVETTRRFGREKSLVHNMNQPVQTDEVILVNRKISGSPIDSQPQ